MSDHEEALVNQRARIDELNELVKEQEGRMVSLHRENRILSARDMFREAGYPPAQGELFAVSVDGDLSPELVSEFVTKYNVPKLSSESESADGAQGGDLSRSGAAPLSSMSRVGTGAGSGGAAGAMSAPMSRDEWDVLNKKDPVAARQALREGRVALREDNFWLKHGQIGL